MEPSPAPSKDEDIGGWGTSKKDYYDADVIETEADALAEEAEARRIQQKQLQGMTEADFGFDEAGWLDAGKKDEEDGTEDEDGSRGAIREVLPQLEVSDDMSSEERLKILRTRYPEFEPLAKEFLDLQEVREDLKLAADAASAVQKHAASQAKGSSQADNMVENRPVAVLKYTALSAYLAALCMYFALFTSNSRSAIGNSTAMLPSELHDHPIMDSLMKTRALWNKVQDLPILSSSNSNTTSPAPATSVPNGHSTGPVDNISEPLSISALAQKPRKRKSHKQKAAEAAEASATALRASRLAETEASLTSLSALTQPRPKPCPKSNELPTSNQGHDSSSDFGDPATLPAHEAARKAAVKKSLKFYTSQIASKAQKRELAGRDAGGDADLPYKERLRDRQERLNELAEKRGKKKSKKGEELGGELEDEDLAIARDVRGDGGDDYYNLISSKSAQKKAEKAARAAAESTDGTTRYEVDDGEEGGKRKVSYAIEKNKGLTPKRKKEVRNPRVKKRKKYEEKRKKLGSVRQIWRGGEGKGYQGEKTGIKGGLIRSVKL